LLLRIAQFKTSIFFRDAIPDLFHQIDALVDAELFCLKELRWIG